MGAQKGKDLLLKVDGTGGGVFTTVAGLRTRSLSFGDSDMLALAERFEKGRFSAQDAMRIIGAGLRGGGHGIADDAVGPMKADGGAAGFVDIVARLLRATFVTSGVTSGSGSGPGSATADTQPGNR